LSGNGYHSGIGGSGSCRNRWRRKCPNAGEQPANKIRSILRFASDVEDKSWYYDKTFWQQYLSLLVAQRFNRFALAFGIGYDFTSRLRDTYFHFAYPFLVSVPGYEVRVPELPDAERDRNLEMLRFISDEAARRGLHFQLGLWTHAYKWTDSPSVNYTVEGLSPENHAAYCQAALETLLMACPAISGVTFRIHGESGVAEGSYGFWTAVFEGIKGCGRPVEIDMHAKGMDEAMIDLAVATGMPVNISPKYWAEHMGLPYHQAAIRPVELPQPDRKDQGFFSRSSGSRSFLRYGYGDLLAENRPYGVLHRMWPGTQRLLLWGDPALAAAYGRASSFCGSSGVELFEPLSFKGRKGSGLPGGRDAYADAALRPRAITRSTSTGTGSGAGCSTIPRRSRKPGAGSSRISTARPRRPVKGRWPTPAASCRCSPPPTPLRPRTTTTGPRSTRTCPLSMPPGDILTAIRPVPSASARSVRWTPSCSRAWTTAPRLCSGEKRRRSMAPSKWPSGWTIWPRLP
jgi:hypothetical protein